MPRHAASANPWPAIALITLYPLSLYYGPLWWTASGVALLIVAVCLLLDSRARYRAELERLCGELTRERRRLEAALEATWPRSPPPAATQDAPHSAAAPAKAARKNS